MRNLIFLGAPGSGKGTQAKNLVESLGYAHISTGDLLRKEIAEKSELGLKVQGILSAGKLVDDQTVMELLQKNLPSNNIILDGFPRNLAQAKCLDKEIHQMKSALAIYFHVDLAKLTERIVNRRSCNKCGAVFNLKFSPPAKDGVCDLCGGTELIHRNDDKEDVLKERFKIFQQNLDELLDFYQTKHQLVKIDASLPPHEITSQLKTILS